MPEKNSTQPKSWRDVIKVHPAADLFPMLSEDELQRLGADIEANGLRSPIVLWAERDNSLELLLDGRNRLDAMEARGLRIVQVDQKKGRLDWSVPTRRYCGMGGGISMIDGASMTADPYAYVVSANVHRRHLTAEQKRELVANILKAAPDKSNRETAKLAKVDHKTVGTIREGLEAVGEIPHLTKTTGGDGKSYPTRAPKPKQTDLEEFTSKPAAAQKWTPWQRERKARVEDGISVVASKRTDHALIAWAEANDRLVLIDRHGIWGNPFEMGDEKDPRDGDRATVIENFRWYLDRRPSLQRKLHQLEGKVLACWCHPDPCHGDVLCDLANEIPRASNGQIDPLEIPAFMKRDKAAVAADN